MSYRLNPEEVTFLRELVHLSEASFVDPALGQGGNVHTDVLAKRLGQWDFDKETPKPEFHRTFRFLNEHLLVFGVGGGNELLYPDAAATDLIRKLDADESKTWFQKRKEWLLERVKKGLDSSIEKGVESGLTWLVLLALGGLAGAVLQKGCDVL